MAKGGVCRRRCHGNGLLAGIAGSTPWQGVVLMCLRARTHLCVCACVCVTEMLNPPWCLSHHFLCSGEQSESCDITVSLRTHSRSAQAAAVFGCIGAAIGTQHIPSVSRDAALCNTLVLSCLLFLIQWITWDRPRHTIATLSAFIQSTGFGLSAALIFTVAPEMCKPNGFVV